MDNISSQEVEVRGQSFSADFIQRFVDCAEIPAGYLITPIELHTENARGMAALYSTVQDFEFALECFKAAQALGRPNPEKVESKALIFAGVTAYVRSFSSNVRGLRLKPENFAAVWDEDDIELHDYLMNLRNKHVAHSVNEFERCDPVGIIVLSPEGVRKEDVSGVGVTLLKYIGLSAQRLELAVRHVQHCIAHMHAKIDEIRPEVHAEMKEALKSGWTMAPMVRMPDHDNVSKARSSFRTLANFLRRITQPR